jgi:dTDP-4-amino-4,6-dideoxygalactose transaminase
MITTNCPHLYKKAWSIKDHGKGYNTVFKKKHPPGFRWLHENMGTNWRMMPIQAVIGSHALDELNGWINHRRKIASIYNNNLKDIAGVRLTIPPENIYHSYYKYYFFIELNKFKITRDEIIELINNENIFCQVGSCSEVYKEQSLIEYKPEDNLVVTKELFETAFLLKCDPCITEEYADECIKKIKNILIDNIK